MNHIVFYTSDTIIVTFRAYFLCHTQWAFCLRRKKKKLFEERMVAIFHHFYAILKGIKQRVCRWWWCRGWLNKIGFNWQVIGKMPRSTETKTLVKTIKKEIFSTEKSFDEGKQKRLKDRAKTTEIQMRIHNQNHIICTPLKANSLCLRRWWSEIERKTEKFSWWISKIFFLCHESWCL